MARGTFTGGIHPYEGKELSKDKPIKSVMPKGDLVYPVSQHIGAPAKPIVQVGDRVLTGQMIAEASIEGTEQYSRDVYEEYVERRKCLIDGVNRIPGCYTPIPMGAFYTVAKLPVDDAEKFCAWCLTDFNYEGETIMMAPAAGFYTTPELGRDEVRLAYVLKKEDLQRALMLLVKALEEYKTINNNQ